jgi:hypothetical protein
MSSYLASPREGHLQQFLHILAYLKVHKRSTLIFDKTEPSYNPERFTKRDWSEIYTGATEAITSNILEERGLSVTTTCFVDTDHAGRRVTRRSRMGMLIFVNRAPIMWYSKQQQNTVESSTFGSECMAMRVALDLIEGLRYKL